MGALPIRKIDETTVALSSYYGKTFVMRAERGGDIYSRAMSSQIVSPEAEKRFQNIVQGNAFNYRLKSARSFSSLSKTLRSFDYVVGENRYFMVFDGDIRRTFFSEEEFSRYEKDGTILLGKNQKNGELITIDLSGHCALIDVKRNVNPLGSLEEFLELDISKIVPDYALARIFAKKVPVVLILGYKYGLQKLIDMLGCSVRRQPTTGRLNLKDHEYAIRFADETLIFSSEDKIAAMVLYGLMYYEKVTGQYSVYTFDKQGVYLKLLERDKLSIRYLKEIDNLDDGFVDPITEGVLKEMGEPTTYLGLLVRSCELLLTDYHEDKLDINFMRIRGYERFAGTVYSEMARAVREHKAKPSRKNSSIDLNPFAVWKKISSDPAVSVIKDTNPFQNLKDQESLTFSGNGGRNSRSMVKEMRQYHPSDMGTVSEATTDSSDVGINTFMSANPSITDLRGRVVSKPLSDLNPTNLFSTSALVAVGSDKDSDKRVNFVSIQNSHMVACEGYHAPFLRTGYEQVMAHRVGEGYAVMAKQAGKVTKLTNKKGQQGLVVEFADGSVQGYEFGRRFGKSDFYIPHDMTCDLSQGQSFEEGEPLIYNSGFFVRDALNPKSLVLKNAMYLNVALQETRQTHEDASAISSRVAAKLSTNATYIKTVVIDFKQNIRNVVQEGQTVEYDTPLCVIEDVSTSQGTLFDEDTFASLAALSNQVPMAKTAGLIDRIDVLYHGETEDMSETLQELAERSDYARSLRAKAAGSKGFTGSVTEDMRIDGEGLALDTVVIRFYITKNVPMGVGDLN